MSSPWRKLISGLLILTTVALTPLWIVGQWLNGTLLNTDTFVANYHPLSTDPQFQHTLAQAISESVATEVADALPLLPTGVVDRQLTALIEKVTTSAEFPTVWDASLRSVHRQLLTALSGGTPSVTLTISTAPIVGALRENLSEAGVPLTSLIPDLDYTIDLIEVNNLDQVRPFYQTARSLSWLPWAWGVAIAGALGFAPHRWRTLGYLGVGVLVAALATNLGAAHNLLAAASTHLPEATLTQVWTITASSLRRTTTWVALGAGIAAVAGLIGSLTHRHAPN